MKYSFEEIVKLIKYKVMQYKKEILIALAVIFLIIVVIFTGKFIFNKLEEKRNNVDISNATHAVVLKEDYKLYRKPKESKWKFKILVNLKVGDNAYILEEYVDEKTSKKWYKAKVNGEVGYLLQESVDSFKFNGNQEFSLMSDVSKFNVIQKTFNTVNEYEAFLLKSGINYVYIRLGGRGYGDEGNFYLDKHAKMFIEACDYLGMPYGFYYLDEALNSEEIDEEVKFVEDFIKENQTENHKLPLAIDVERHDGKGRADSKKLWEEERKFLVQELVDKFIAKGIGAIIYTNAQLAHDYLTEVDAYFWVAYYDKENHLPKELFDQIEEHDVLTNEELMPKIVGWQFTDKGVKEKIPEKVDLSIVNNDFFKQFVK